MAINPLNLPPMVNVPQIDFSPLADIPKAYRENQMRANRERTLAELGKGGDFATAGKSLLASGDLEAGLTLFKLGLDQKKQADELGASQEFGRQMGGAFGPQSSSAPAPMSNPSDPRGIRNNNPLNIESGQFASGQPGYAGTDGRFARFASADQGLGAADQLLQTYSSKHGLNTVAGIVGRWAPAKDGNDVAAYAANVARQVGVDPNAPLDMANPEVRQKLIGAMGQHENGRQIQVAQGQPAQTDTIPGVFAGAPPGKLIPALITGANNPRLPKQSQELAKTLLEHALKQSDLPGDVKEYLFAKGQGYGKTYSDWKAESDERKASKTQVNIDQKGETKYDESMNKHFADLNTDIIKSSASARGKIATLDRLSQLLSDPNIYTGKGGNLVLEAKRAAKAIGIDVGDVGGAEAVRAISNQFALEMRNPAGGAGMPGAMSDQDREFLRQIVPGLQNNPEGNAQLINYQKRLAQRSIEVEQLRRDYIKRNKRLGEDFYQELSDYSEKNPLFPEAPKAGPKADADGWTVIDGVRIRKKQ